MAKHHSAKQARVGGRFVSAKAKASEPTPKLNFSTVGAPSEAGGFRGIAEAEPYNPELAGIEGYKVMDRMAASDPTVSAVLRAHFTPIMAAEWTVEPANDDAIAIDAADMVRDQLFGMDDTWEQFIAEALDHATFGFYSFEKVWEMSEGQARLKALAPRPPIELTEVLSDRDGAFLGVIQRLSRQTAGDMPPGFPVDRMRLDKDEDVWIEPQMLCHLVRHRRGGNYTGRSMLRPVYKPWYIKTNLEMIAGIAIERRSMGVDTIKPPAGATPAQKRDAELAMMGLHSREMQYLVVPEGWEYSLEGLRGGTIDPEKFLEYCDIGIARGAGAEFIMMGGQGASGSFAQHADKTSLFMAGLLALPNTIRQAVSCQIVPDILRFNVDPNFPRELMPNVQITRLDARNLTEIATASVQLQSAGLLGEITDEDRSAFRKMLELTAIDPNADDDEDEGPGEDRVRLPETPGAGDEDDSADDVPNPLVEAQHAAWLAARKDRIEQLPRSDFPVTQFMDADQINQELDATREAIMASARRHQKAQVRAMVTFAAERWQAGDKAGILKPKVPLLNEVAEAFGDHLFALSETGREMVRTEVTLQAEAGGVKRKFAIPPVNKKSASATKRYLMSRGKAMSKKLANQLNSAYQFSILPMVRDGSFDAAVLSGHLDGLALRDVATAARLSVSEALSLGRKAQQEQFEADGDVEYYVYSTATESDTCAACESLEGARIESGSDDFQRFYPPLRDGPLGPCEGADGCNCDMFAVFDTSE